jgi:hypothetical protein
MTQLAEINDKFIDDYIFNHRNNLGKPTMGGTDWRFADIVAPAFREVLDITESEYVLEIGFQKGGSALMFLSINPSLFYHSLDIEKNSKSIGWLSEKFTGFMFVRADSKDIGPESFPFRWRYDLIFIDGNHEDDYVISDIEKSLSFDPEYILLDDYRHPSHNIESIVIEKYKDKLEVVKVFEFNQCWQGYSMALCKVKNA